MAKPTPGPWELVPNGGCTGSDENYWGIYAGCGFFSTECPEAGFDISGCMSEANARLLAASWELYEACKALMAIVDESDGVAGYHLNGEIATWGEFECAAAARAAIAKAEEGSES